MQLLIMCRVWWSVYLVTMDYLSNLISLTAAVNAISANALTRNIILRYFDLYTSIEQSWSFFLMLILQLCGQWYQLSTDQLLWEKSYSRGCWYDFSQIRLETGPATMLAAWLRILSIWCSSDTSKHTRVNFSHNHRDMRKLIAYILVEIWHSFYALKQAYHWPGPSVAHGPRCLRFYFYQLCSQQK